MSEQDAIRRAELDALQDVFTESLINLAKDIGLTAADLEAKVYETVVQDRKE